MLGHYKRVVPNWRTRWGSNPQGAFARLIKSQVGQPTAQRVHNLNWRPTQDSNLRLDLRKVL